MQYLFFEGTVDEQMARALAAKVRVRVRVRLGLGLGLGLGLEGVRVSIMTLVPGRVGRARPGGRGRRLVVHLDEVELGEAQLGQPDSEGGPVGGARLLRATG